VEQPSVLCIIGDAFSGSNHWRVTMPFSFLQRKGINAVWAENLEDSVAEETAVYDIIIFSRLAFPSAQDIRRYVKICHRHGKLVITDVDDDLVSFTHYIEPSMPELEREKMHRDLPLLRVTLQESDAVTVTNAHLSARIQAVTKKPTAVIPNMLDLGWWDSTQKAGSRQVDGRVSIGWIGGRRNALDLELLAQVWTRVAELRPEVQFVVGGWPSEDLLASVPRERITHLPWTFTHTYPWMYLSVDIGCCPLAPSIFNLSKSPIKAIEHGATCTPVVASPAVYASTMKNIDVAMNMDEWVEKLLDLVDDRARAMDRGLALRGEVVRSWSLEANWLKIPMGWESVLTQNRQRRDKSVLLPSDATISWR
jgi:hypothetical protein